jgi:3-methyladenine DNA glycosylase AlkD
MNLQEVMAQLEAAGTQQNRKTYRNHGVKGEQVGVSFAFLDKLVKQIKHDHDLALALWATGNQDARLLATRVADPARLDDAPLDAWAQGLDNYVITDAFGSMVARSRLAREKMETWTGSDDEWIGAAGWNILAHLAMQDKTLPDDYFRPYLAEIRRDIHSRKNRVRYSMNNAMIAIGVRNPALEDDAIAAANRVGMVDVDHLQTNCKTPDAAAYIRKTWEHRDKKKATAAR